VCEFLQSHFDQLDESVLESLYFQICSKMIAEHTPPTALGTTMNQLPSSDPYMTQLLIVAQSSKAMDIDKPSVDLLDAFFLIWLGRPRDV
tara:strand:- start:2123 stop:2392 length:270 start_codon:yes stop_codon:yes gene_type:complete